MSFKIMAAALVAAVSLGIPQVLAQDQWAPERPFSLVVAFAAGGGTDIVARTAASVLSQQLGQQVNVINKPGAGGLTGTLDVARARPDGYTIGFVATNLNVHGWQQPGSVTPDDFIPLALVNVDPGGFQVRADSPFKTLKEAMDAWKANPSGFTSSASGAGGVWHVALLKLAMQQGIDPKEVIFVPTGGAGPSINELIAGGVDFAPTSLVEAAPQIKSGQVRALAVLAKERLEAFPDVPTVREELGEDVLHFAWRGFVVPKGTPDDVVARLKTAIRAVYESAEFTSQMDTLGYGMQWAEGDDFGVFMKEQYESSGAALEAAGLLQ